LPKQMKAVFINHVAVVDEPGAALYGKAPAPKLMTASAKHSPAGGDPAPKSLEQYDGSPESERQFAAITQLLAIGETPARPPPTVKQRVSAGPKAAPPSFTPMPPHPPKSMCSGPPPQQQSSQRAPTAASKERPTNIFPSLTKFLTLIVLFILMPCGNAHTPHSSIIVYNANNVGGNRYAEIDDKFKCNDIVILIGTSQAACTQHQCNGRKMEHHEFREF